jgi:hypothetical protein
LRPIDRRAERWSAAGVCADGLRNQENEVNCDGPSGDPDGRIIDDKMAEARERIGRIEKSAGGGDQNGEGRIPEQETAQEPTMDKEHTESLAERVKNVIEDAFGLPPGDRSPHGQGRPMSDPNTPHGSLTADDAEGVPVHDGTGIKAE